MVKYVKASLDAPEARFAIVASIYNERVTAGLTSGALAALEVAGAKNVTVYVTPGAFEMPLTVKKLAASGRYDAIICVGSVIKGQTYHFEVISDSVVHAIQQVALETGIPVTLGLLTAYDRTQALKRSGAEKNKGAEAAFAAVGMVDLLRQAGS